MFGENEYPADSKICGFTARSCFKTFRKLFLEIIADAESKETTDKLDELYGRFYCALDGGIIERATGDHDQWIDTPIASDE